MTRTIDRSSLKISIDFLTVPTFLLLPNLRGERREGERERERERREKVKSQKKKRFANVKT